MHDGGTQIIRAVPPKVLNLQNLRGQSLLFRCLETGFVTTAPALTRYQKARGVDPGPRVGDGSRWCRSEGYVWGGGGGRGSCRNCMNGVR